MIIDTSALIAILLNEPEAEDLIRQIVATPRCKRAKISAKPMRHWVDYRGIES